MKAIEFSDIEWEWILTGLNGLLINTKYSETSNRQIATIINKLYKNNVKLLKFS